MVMTASSRPNTQRRLHLYIYILIPILKNVSCHYLFLVQMGRWPSSVTRKAGGQFLTRRSVQYPSSLPSSYHFKIHFPEDWFLEDTVPHKRSPFLRVWYKREEGETDNNRSHKRQKLWLNQWEFEFMLHRIKNKESLGWLPSAEEVDCMQYHLIQNPSTKELAERIFAELNPTTWRFLFTLPKMKQFTPEQALWAIKRHDRLKWPIYNKMLLRHDRVIEERKKERTENVYK